MTGASKVEQKSLNLSSGACKTDKSAFSKIRPDGFLLSQKKNLMKMLLVEIETKLRQNNLLNRQMFVNFRI